MKKKWVQGENGKEGDGRAKECTYQVSPEWTGFLTEVQVVLIELERGYFSASTSHSDTISSVIFQ